MIFTNNTLFIGKVLHKLETVDSTNQYALDLLSKSKPSEGTIILAHHQYAGRGQMTKYWESEPGKNLTFTLVLYPTFLIAKQQFFLNQAIALGILKTVQYFIPKKCTIKWPNDIYVEDRKITGILIQNTLKGTSLQSAIAGIGLNVNQQVFTSGAPNPTSILLETGKEFALAAVLDYLCQQIEYFYLKTKAKQFTTIQQAYHQHLYRYKEWHYYKRPDGSLFKGMILGLTDFGLLRLQTEDGEKAFDLKEIGYVI